MHKKLTRELKKHRLLDALFDVMLREEHPLEMRFIASTRIIKICAANTKELDAILEKYKDVIED